MYKDISVVFIQFVVYTFYPKQMGYFFLVYFSNDVDFFSFVRSLYQGKESVLF